MRLIGQVIPVNSQEKWDHIIGRVEALEKQVAALKKKKTTFVPPTVEEVKEVLGSEAQAFHDFYDCKNWFVGKNKMTQWKKAAAGWKRRDKDKQPSINRSEIVLDICPNCNGHRKGLWHKEQCIQGEANV